jgi:YidC/Oxa1 family membrane protein insertase
MSVLAVLDPAVRLAYALVSGLSDVLPVPLAVVLFTIGVRLLLHPLVRAAVRGEQARARLAPRVAELTRRHRGRPGELQAALAELYREEKSSPFAGCLPALVQMPVFSVMYRLFTLPAVAGHPNHLLHEGLFGVPLGLHAGSARGPAQAAVFLALHAGLAAVALVTFRRARRTAATAAAAATAPTTVNQGDPGAAAARIAPYLSFATVLFAALVPLAAGLYLLTTTAWTAAERWYLLRVHGPHPEPARAAAGPTRAAPPVALLLSVELLAHRPVARARRDAGRRESPVRQPRRRETTETQARDEEPTKR